MCELCRAGIAWAFVVPLLALGPSKLAFQLTRSQIYTSVNILAGLGANKNLAMLCPCNYLHTGISARLAIDNYLDLIDAVVVLRKLRSLLLGMASDSFGYVEMFTSNCKKQNYSP